MPIGKYASVAALCALALVALVPICIAAFSPLLAYRSGAYIIGGFAGILCLSLLLVQPILAAGHAPWMTGAANRRWHRWIGMAIVLCVALHVGGLYLASPPDVLDALLLVSPTPFSVYGVTAMWGIVATAFLYWVRRKSWFRYAVWRRCHTGIALIVVISTVIHAVQIQGAMESISKWVLCLAVLAVTAAVLSEVWVLRPLRRVRQSRATGADRTSNQ